MKTMTTIELEIEIKIRTKDEEKLRAWGFSFERNAIEILEEYYHNIAEQIRLNEKLKGIEKNE